MNFEFENNIPIYIQIVEQLKIDIISGKLEAGERLPSVRELAIKTKVNPNTMQRALTELEERGLIYTERTNGKFVTEDKTLILQYKEEYAKGLADKYLRAMEEIGYSKEDSAKYFDSFGGNK